MNKNILIVEDDEDIARNLCDLLESEGYNVNRAENGKVAINLLVTTSPKPAIILLDLMMPVMNGFEFKDQLNLHPEFHSIPIVIMSADGNVEEKKQKIGALEYLKKPVDIDLILRTVEKYCC